MNSVKELGERTRLGDPVGSSALVMVPVTREIPSALRYESLQAALAAKTLQITELNAAGSVPEVQAVNDGALPVLLLDGAALVGAKQNRVINLTVLIPARSEVTVPVSCVEQGRWRAESREFTEGKAMHFAAARAQKLRDVSESLERCGQARSNQGRVWADMADYSVRFNADAPSGAMQDVYRAVEESTDKIIEGLRPVEGQVGAVFVNGNALLGMDLFDSASTFRAEFPKVVRSYAVEAVRRCPSRGEETETPVRPQVVAGGLLHRLAEGDWKSYPGLGLGTDIRLSAGRVAAGGLVYQDEIVHLAAFPEIGAERRDGPRHAPPMPRFARRH